MLALQALWIPLSYLLGDHARTSELERTWLSEQARAVFAALGGSLPAEPAGLAVGLWPRVAITVVIFGAMSAIALRLLAAARERSADLSPDVLRKLLRYALVFSILPIAMLPVGPHDVWVYMVWGRMFLAGQNPYYEYPDADAMAGIPVEAVLDLTPYGPLWSLSATAIAALGRGSFAFEFVWMKLAMAGGWCALVATVRYAVAERSALDQARALLVVGWLPASWFFTVAEGHNDIWMVLGIVGWLALHMRGGGATAPFALVASVLSKYISLPFFALDAWMQLRHPPRRPLCYFATLGLAVAIAAAAFSIYARDLGVFDELVSQLSKNLLTPAFAIREVTLWLGLPPLAYYYNKVITVLILAPAIPTGLRFAQHARAQDATVLAMAALLYVFLVMSSHAWPSYSTWVLPLAALVATRGYAKVSIAIALLAPVPNFAFASFEWLAPLSVVWWFSFPVVLYGLHRSRILEADVPEV